MNKDKSVDFNVTIITTEEAREQLNNYSEILYLLNKVNKSRTCKADVHPEFLSLSFCIPEKTSNATNFSRFLCVISKNNILFIDDTGKIGYYIKKMQKNKVLNEKNIGRFIYDFMETLIDGELRYLEEFNDRIVKIENAIVSGDFNNFEHKMLTIKRENLIFYRYYSQLMDIGQELQENENGFFNKESLYYFRLLTDRIGQLHEEAKILRDYTIQLRGIYQTQFDMRQNKIMKTLTIVTTVFSPLTIIVGWYGMNFKNMPELEWDYGYSMVILLSITALSISLWILRKNKFL